MPQGSLTQGEGQLPTMKAPINQLKIAKVPANPCYVTTVSMERRSKSIGKNRIGKKRKKKICHIVLWRILIRKNKRRT